MSIVSAELRGMLGHTSISSPQPRSILSKAGTSPYSMPFYIHGKKAPESRLTVPSEKVASLDVDTRIDSSALVTSTSCM